MGRFINADGLISTGQGFIGYDTFTYCNNNPIVYLDTDGTIPLTFSEKWNQYIANVIDDLVESISGVSKEEHYNRNAYNLSYPESLREFQDQYQWVTETAWCHQFSAEGGINIKYVSPDGHHEAIYSASGKLVTDVRDIGTYNFCSPKTNKIGHMRKDVLTWFAWGNAKNDTTTCTQRIASFLGLYYVKAKLRAKLKNRETK